MNSIVKSWRKYCCAAKKKSARGRVLFPTLASESDSPTSFHGIRVVYCSLLMAAIHCTNWCSTPVSTHIGQRRKSLFGSMHQPILSRCARELARWQEKKWISSFNGRVKITTTVQQQKLNNDTNNNNKNSAAATSRFQRHPKLTTCDRHTSQPSHRMPFRRLQEEINSWDR